MYSGCICYYIFLFIAFFRKHVFPQDVPIHWDIMQNFTSTNLSNPRLISLHPCHNIAYTPYVGVYMVLTQKVWLKLACWFWRRFFKNFSLFLLFCYYLPLGKGIPFHLKNLNSPPPKDDLCQLWSKLAQWFWRSRKCKSLQTDGQRAIRKAHLSYDEVCESRT
jgi:hypothetical protein